MAAPHTDPRYLPSPPAEPSIAPDSTRIADALYNWCRDNGELGDVFSQRQLLNANIIPNRDVNLLLAATTLLVNNHLFKIHDVRGSGIGWELVSHERAENYRELNPDEQMVFGVIESAGTSGLWTKTIKAKLNQHAKVADKACRSLEIKSLIKQMKSVKNPSRKMFILADLTPNEEATGGAWFTDGSLDVELMDMIANVIELVVSKKSWIEEVETPDTAVQVTTESTVSPASSKKRNTPQDGFDAKGKGKAKVTRLDDDRPRSQTPEAKPTTKSKSLKGLQPKKSFEPYPAGHLGYPTAIQISNELNKMRVSHTALPHNAISQLLDVMVYDDRLYKLYRPPSPGEVADAAAETRVAMFKCIRNVEQVQEKNGLTRKMMQPKTRKAALRLQELEDIGKGGSTEVPCLRCPVLHLCAEGGPVNVETCEYFDDWFSKMDEADREGMIEVDGTEKHNEPEPQQEEAEAIGVPKVENKEAIDSFNFNFTDEPHHRLFNPNSNPIYGHNRPISQLLTYDPSKAPFRQFKYTVLITPGDFKTDTHSLVVSLDGACRGNGTPTAKSAYGVFFGPDSPHNDKGALPADLAQSSQHAEIYAAIKTVERTLQIIKNDMSKSHVILITDSQYLVSSMTEYLENWKSNSWRNSKGKAVKHKESFERLDGLILGMESDGIDVQFWHVPRSHNQEADRLANEGLDAASTNTTTDSFDFPEDSSFLYWNRTVPTIPEAKALAERLFIDIPSGDLMGFKAGLMYPVRRLVTTGQDSPQNMRLLFGPAWQREVKKIWEDCRIGVLLTPQTGSPAQLVATAMDDERASWRPRPPTREEEQKMGDIHGFMMNL